MDSRLLLGFIGEDLCACISHSRVEDDLGAKSFKLAYGFDGPIRTLQAVAVSTSHRGRGGAVADEAMSRALDDIITREAGVETLVTAKIDIRNEPSEAMAGRHGFEPLSAIPATHPLRGWYVLVGASEEEAELAD